MSHHHNKILRFPRLPDTREKLLQSVIDKLSKKYGKSEEKGISSLGESIFAEDEQFITSGIYPIDCVVCFGKGFPVGIVEIYGPPGSGKSAILEHTLAEAQRRGYFTGLFPMEYSIRFKRAVRVGIDPRKLVIFDSETIEDVYDQIRDFVKNIRKKDKNTLIVIGWDTVAATPTRTELEDKKGKGLEQSDMGKFAAQMSKLFRRLVRFLRKNNVLLLCINQTRTNIGKMFGDRETTYGGMALKFYAWIRLRVYPGETIKRDGVSVGVMSEVYVKKNKVDKPHRKCKLPIFWGHGIDKNRALWEYAKDMKVVKLRGSSYQWHHKKVNRKIFGELLEKNRDRILEELRNAS